MQFDKKLLKNKKIVFLGIGGISMSSLSCFVQQNGGRVFGYDKNRNSELVVKLQKSGIFVTDNENELPPADFCVYSDAIPKEIVKRTKAQRSFSRGEFLGFLLNDFSTSVAVCGSHGKTTTVAMLGEILLFSPATVLLGGESYSFLERSGWGNFLLEGNAICVVEACEYRRNLKYLKPSIGVGLNIDLDHTDCYKNIGEIEECFCQFIRQSSIGIINGDDKRFAKCKEGIRFSILNKAEYRAVNINNDRGRYSFDCEERGNIRGRISLSVIGKHQIYNALAVIAVARQLFIPFSIIQERLNSFRGVKRRMECLGKMNGKGVFADYAHHPKEITHVIHAFSEMLSQDYSVVFQPHTYSRTRDLFMEFIQSLYPVQNLAIYKTYAAREKSAAMGEEWELANNLKAIQLKDTKDLTAYLNQETKKGHAVLVLGAGNIYEEVKKVIKKGLHKEDLVINEILTH